MVDRLVAFWRGRVYFSVRGGNPALFLNRILHDGIPLFHTQKSEQGLRAQVSLRDFPRLRRAVRLSHVHLKILAKYGWPFIAARWWKRKGLILGLIVIISALSILSQLVLFVTVTGNKVVNSTEILKKAEDLGLKTWVWYRDLDLNQIATTLQENFPDAAWVGIGRKGTHIEISIVEKIRLKVHTEAGNLVAAKTGLVQEVMVIQGTPQVHEGETVRAGQVLIEKAASSAAKGFVRGRVWYSAEAKTPLVEDKVTETGRISQGWGIKIGSRVIMVTTPDSPYPLVQKDVQSRILWAWRNWRFPVEVIIIEYKELEQVHLERSPEEARLVAENAARSEIQQKLTPNVFPMEERVRVLPSPSGFERVRVEVETYEDLAVYPNP
ncbi:MAG: sporulation protein YqfD [Desulfitobacteriaceae bacterium]